MFDNLKSAYRIHGVEGIQNLLTEKRDNGGPRVTKNAAVTDTIVQLFSIFRTRTSSTNHYHF
jgi:hypothetical protein